MSTATPKKSKQRKPTICLRVCTVEDSGQDVLYRYLQDGSMLGSTKELVNRAIRSFWLPFAYQNSHSTSEVELRVAAIDCVAQLQAQILLIQECFDLKPLGITIDRSQNSFNLEAISPSTDRTTIDTTTASLPVLNSPEYFDYDDSVFSTMLNGNSS
ncbi:hypothetical protein ACQ4M3_24360 [Leptolyngbya sp. AN03gr2]|uniref:hypothetical protein n=1 Tax=unclassified Leptolyngbya TaxID=2650499 RepID=UPI003D315DAE